MASGIKNKVVIAGMGCSKFGERWSCGPDDLMVEAFGEALEDAGIERDRIEAAWLGVFFDEQSTGKSSLPMSMALRLPNVPTTRVENLCATGTEALRGAVYAVAAGACDIARAMAHISCKSHENAARNPKAHLRNRIPPQQVLDAPAVAYPLGVLDCCGVSDGAACAIVTTLAIARSLGKRDLVSVQAMQ